MKTLLSIIFLALFSFNSYSQEIKLFSSYLRLNDMGTRYVVVLNNNSIWWFAPGNPWQKSSINGLPSGYNIKLFSAYSKEDGSSRYVAVLSDNSIWWFAPGNPWEKSTTNGLPSNYNIKHFNAYSKEDGTRYVAVLSDNSIWWFAPGQPWQKSSTAGLPK